MQPNEPKHKLSHSRLLLPCPGIQRVHLQIRTTRINNMFRAIIYTRDPVCDFPGVNPVITIIAHQNDIHTRQSKQVRIPDLLPTPTTCRHR
jgi:hypothetical protein